MHSSSLLRKLNPDMQKYFKTLALKMKEDNEKARKAYRAGFRASNDAPKPALPETEHDKLDEQVQHEHDEIDKFIYLGCPMQLCKVLGKGTYGCVYAATLAGSDYAIKVYEGDHSSAGPLLEVAKEHEFLSALQCCPFVVRSFGSIASVTGATGLLMERASSNLAHVLNSKEIDLERQSQAMFQILSALAFLSDHRILHGDLKPQNVLCFLACPEHSDHHIPFSRLAIADFGLARLLRKGFTRVRGCAVYTEGYRNFEALHANTGEAGGGK